MKLMHTTEVKSVIELQGKDTSIDELAERAASVPAEIAALREAFEAKKNSMNTARETLVQLRVDRKAKELAVTEKEEEIKKHHRDLNSIKNNDAYKALQAEIERARKEQDGLETEILGLLEAIDAAAEEDKKLQAETQKLQAENELRIKALEDAGKATEAALESARKGRDAFAAGIGAEILEKYEFIRARRKGLGVARVLEDKDGKLSCGGCNMGLTAQKAIDVRTHDALVFCDSCQRIIYLFSTVFGGNAASEAGAAQPGEPGR